MGERQVWEDPGRTDNALMTNDPIDTNNLPSLWAEPRVCIIMPSAQRLHKGTKWKRSGLHRYFSCRYTSCPHCAESSTGLKFNRNEMERRDN
ncbi:hypothetical protein CHARACLAT_017245 [Characodon lateralis]|uniref:Uncharacterized protein n=1 Tax=Characodon lateralis TaxID=208331 RepID=A0ABU7D0N2_9TELE|nr:hypothetical protein [Characodon lateralis]